ncbi:MAG: hypothetical protein WC455_13875 [Dehalococcoidia bacterium]|jgi:hypothetical protein
MWLAYVVVIAILTAGLLVAYGSLGIKHDEKTWSARAAGHMHDLIRKGKEKI